MASIEPTKHRRAPVSVRRVRIGLALGVAFLAIAAIVAATGSGPPRLPLPGIGKPARAGDPFAYSSSRERSFINRAIAGNAQVLFTKSPGGAISTAARVARLRTLIDSAAAGTGIDPNLLEGIVFVESAGRPDVIAGTDPAAASGLTQILASTGQSLLGMHVDLAQSRKLTGQMAGAAAHGRGPRVVALARQRAKIDDRFDPRKALAGTVRYLRLAERRFGRSDLAIVSYHMGIGNLLQVLGDYDGGHSVPYAQLYFDTAPDNHTAAFNLLQSFGDQSSLYFWRVLGAVRIMHLYRSDRAALQRLAGLELATDSNAAVLHPPDRTPTFADPGSLYGAYSQHELVPLPSDPRRLGLAYQATIGAAARRVGAPAALYRGLRAPALDMLVELAARVRTLSERAPLTVAGAVTDRRYEGQVGRGTTAQSTGYAFQIERRYASRKQAGAFQAMLDRLQALNLIAWVRGPRTIEVTVASDASQAIVDGP